ncbi:MAG: GTP-binding protein [Corynebacterium sp.]|nr:GTP-binding protein [Corynebacterium sp.]
MSTDTLRICTAGSVDDGKSTFVGRLLFDTNNIAADQLEAAKRASAPGTLDLSLLVDGLRAEREQGITIDVAYRYFRAFGRTFILADTPGHVQYTRNTVTGLSTSQVTIVLVDIRNGVTDQTRKHINVAQLLGIKDIIIAANKMDLIDWDEARFNAVAADIAAIAPTATIVPVSALTGDNIVTRSEAASWYSGPTIGELLAEIEVATESYPFRFPVQYVLRDSEGVRSYAGQVATGDIAVGDEVSIITNGSTVNTAHITEIRTTDGPVERASAGSSIELVIDSHVDIARGDLIAVTPPISTRTLSATAIGLSDKQLDTSSGILNFRYGTSVVRARITNGEITTNGLDQVDIQLASDLPVEPYAARGAVGSFLLIHPATGDTLAAGLAR